MPHGRTFSFYATKIDIMPALKRVESLRDIIYYREGSFEYPVLPEYDSCELLPGLGIARSLCFASQDGYVVLPKDDQPYVDIRTLRSGEVRSSIGPRGNETSIMLEPAGIYQFQSPYISPYRGVVDAPGAIIEGRIETGHSKNKLSLVVWMLPA